MQNQQAGARQAGRGAALIALAALAAPLLTVPASSAAGPRVLVTSLVGSATAAADAVRSAGGTVIDNLPLVGGVSAQLPTGTVLAPAFRVLADSPLTVAAAPGRSEGAAATVRQTLGLGEPADEGAGVTVAVLDTGVAHVADLGGRLTSVDVTGAGKGDGYGHGTFVAGLVAGSGASSSGAYAGVAPGADILDVRVADKNGRTSLVTVLKGLQAVDEHGADVVNLSLASGSPLPYQIDPLSQALEALWRRGVVVVVPSGNDGPDAGSVSSPGSDPVLLTVGGLDENGDAERGNDTVAEWSGRGPAPQDVAKPDVTAPGSHVVSLRAPGSHVDRANPNSRVGDSYFRGSGTSFATAVASGAAAALLAKQPGLSPDQVKAHLTGTAYTVPGGVNAAGAGGLDLAKALRTPAPDVPDAPETVAPGDPAVWTALLDALLRGDRAAAASSWSQLSVEARNWAASSWSQLPLAARNWAASSWSARTWAAGPDGSVEEWLARNWAARSWAARNWADSDWSASSWSARNWAAGSWSARNWAARNWAASSWSARNWADSDWSASSWSARNWAAGSWSARNWAARNWAASSWSARNWADSDWSASSWSARNWSGFWY